jgi:hypothetical protein
MGGRSTEEVGTESSERAEDHEGSSARPFESASVVRRYLYVGLCSRLAGTELTYVEGMPFGRLLNRRSIMPLQSGSSTR